MNWVKGFALATCLVTPVSVIVATAASAEDTKPTVTTPDSAAKPAMSEADRRAKATDCSKQADAKGLHGEARKKFRAECKRK